MRGVENPSELPGYGICSACSGQATNSGVLQSKKLYASVVNSSFYVPPGEGEDDAGLAAWPARPRAPQHGRSNRHSFGIEHQWRAFLVLSMKRPSLPRARTRLAHSTHREQPGDVTDPHTMGTYSLGPLAGWFWRVRRGRVACEADFPCHARRGLVALLLCFPGLVEGNVGQGGPVSLDKQTTTSLSNWRSRT